MPMGAKAKPALQSKSKKPKVAAPSDLSGEALLGLSRDPVLIVAADTLRIISSNPAASELYGYAAKELTEQTLLDLSPERERALADKKLRRSALGKKEFHHLR